VVKYKAPGVRGRTVADAGQTTKVWAQQFYAGQVFGQDERFCNNHAHCKTQGRQPLPRQRMTVKVASKTMDPRSM
jgi:hypothetical protein